MDVPSVIFLVIVGFSYGLSYSLGPITDFADEYYFEAEEINLISGVVKPFQVWYSTELNKTRVDLYNGTVKRYYYGLGEEYYDYYDGADTAYTMIYMIHPIYNEKNEKVTQICNIETDDVDNVEFLPKLSDFEHQSSFAHNGLEAQVWVKVTLELGVEKLDEELVLYEDDGIAIPVRHTTKKYNLADGSLTRHSVINYYNYNKNVSVENLEVPDDIKCTSFDYDFHKGIQFLHPTIPSDVKSAFKKYKKHHNRKYKGEEHEMRKNIFKDNWEFINDHNSKNLGYVLEVNEFADKRANELSYLTGIRSFDEVPIKSGKGHNGPIKAHNNSHKSIKAHERSAGPPIRDRDGSNGPIKGSPYTEEELPENFDLRMLGVISPVQNQAHCGSCWAFAAAATLEGAIAHSNGGRIMDFSEQALVDCAWDYDCEGCQGTLSIGAVFEYVKAHGIPTVDEYGPYLEEDGYCKVGNMSHLYKINGAEKVTPNDEEALKTAIYKYGPVALGVHVSQAMIFYKSGIFYDPKCPEGGINHAVSAIGYGYKDGELFWVIKNSWGESWGSDGYLYITAKNNNCNVMMTPYYVIVTE